MTSATDLFGPALCASVRCARPATAKVSTRFSFRWSSSSLTHLLETHLTQMTDTPVFQTTSQPFEMGAGRCPGGPEIATVRSRAARATACWQLPSSSIE
jgi:hypothetical protein